MCVFWVDPFQTVHLTDRVTVQLIIVLRPQTLYKYDFISLV